MTDSSKRPSKPLLPLILSGAYLLITTAAICGALGLPPAAGRFTEGLFLVATAGAGIWTLARSLPAQNVVVVSLLVAMLGGAVSLAGSHTGVPFGRFIYTEDFAASVLGLIPWPVPVIWLAAVLSSRGVARLIMRPWRKTGKYGVWVIALTALLTLLIALGLEPYAARGQRYWLWLTPEGAAAWHTAPWANFIGWTATAALMLIVATPWLIRKQGGRSKSSDYRPLVLWLSVNLFLAAGNAHFGFWTATGLTLAGTAVATFYAVRGARW